MFAWFSVDELSDVLSVFCPYSVRIIARVFTGTSTRPLCAFGFFHPQVIPLLVSSHLLNVPFIVSWLNIIGCNSPCTVIYNTAIISELDLEKCLSVLCRFSVDVSTGFCRFCVILLSMYAWCSVDILPVFIWYSVCIIARVHRNQHKADLCLRIRPLTSGPTYCIVPLVKRPTYCVMTECNSL